MIIDSLRGKTLGQILSDSAVAHGDLLFLVEGEEQLTFAAFAEKVDRIAAGMVALGIGRGDKLGLWLPNGFEWAAVFFAAAKIGAAVVPINTRYKAEEASYVIAQSDCKALIITPPQWDVDYYTMLCESAPELAGQQAGLLALHEFPSLRHVFYAGDEPPAGTRSLPSLPAGEAEMAALRRAEAEVRPEDVLLICYTSGTTGAPKGAMHSHAVVRQATRVGIALHVEAGEAILGHMPFYHVAGLFMALIPAMTLGASLIIMKDWKPGLAMDLIKRHHIAVIGGIPTHFHDMIAEMNGQPRDLTSVKSAWIGGSSVPRAMYERVRSVLGIPKLLSTYGMTENTISTTFNGWNDHFDVVSANKAPVLADCEVAIVDPISSAPLAVGEEGEIRCRGETVMLGYFNKPEETQATITPDGWLKTGDLGRFDEHGYLSVTGRIKEMFKVGGTNAYPAEIENYLAQHPDISMAAVVGVPDERLGEVAFAFIIPRAGTKLDASDVVAHCKRGIANYKVPRYVRFVSDFPRTPSGKIRKVELAANARSEIGVLEIT